MNSLFTLSRKYFITKGLFLIQILFLISNLLKYSIAIFIKYLTSDANFYLYKVQRYCLIIIICLSVMFISSYLSNKLFLIYSNKKITILRIHLIEKYFSSPHESYEEKYGVGDINYLLNEDISCLKNFWFQVYGTLPSQLFSFLYVVYKLKINIYLAISILLFSIIYLIILVIYSKLVKDDIKEYKKSAQNLSKVLYNYLSKVELIKLFNIKKDILSKIYEKEIVANKYNENYYLSQNNLIECIYIFKMLGLVLIIYIGVILIHKNLIKFGDLISFLTLINISLQPLNNFINMFVNIKSVNVSSNRIYEYLNENQKENDKKLINYIGKINNIKLKNVELKKHDITIIKNINIDINSYGIYAICGRNGIGKTTLAKTLCYLYKEYTGTILLNNNNINSIDENILRKKIIYISNDEGIFEDTIKYNFTLNKTDKISDECLSLFNNSIKERISNEINSNISTFNLSKGEKQIIYYSRAILLNYDVIIIDEPELSIDYQTMDKLIKLLKKQSMGKIIILISHNKKIKECAKKCFILK